MITMLQRKAEFVFFPLMKSMDLEGWVNIVYFPPNNWEYLDKKPKYLYLIYPNGAKWKTVFLEKITFSKSRLFSTQDFKEIFFDKSLALIYPSPKILDSELDFLPNFKTWSTNIPAWRASSGFKNSYAQVSYQSDIEPLPEKGSLLTFHPFIQFSKLKNYLVVLNAQSNPRIVNHSLLIFNSKSKEFIGKTQIQTNSVTTIDLDQFGFESTDLPVFVSKGMAAIPFGLGINLDMNLMSLEHTHPPASFVVRGDRNKIQKQIKSKWLEKLKVDLYEN